MSDSEREDDLFGGSEAGSPAAERQQSPIASSSKAASPAPAPAPATPAADEEDDADVGDLFGDDDDDEDEGAPKPAQGRGRSTTRSSRSRSRSRLGSENPLEYPEEEDGEVQRHEESWATLPLPQWDKMQATDDKVWHMKLPAYVNIDSRPYDPDLYRETLDEEPIDEKANPVAAKSKMIGVRNTIRWRWVTGGDGEPTRQSNARMLRWSDGSVSLQLGSDLFDVAPSHGATLARPSDPKPPVPAGKVNEKAVNTVSSKNFLYSVAHQEQILVAERAIAGQLSLLPTSMDSKTHLELVKHVGQQHVKHSRMKMLEETADEETLQKLLLKGAPNRELIKSNKTSSGAGGRRSNLAGGSGSGLGRTRSGLGNKRRSLKKSYYSDSSDEDGSESDRGRSRKEIRKIRGGSRELGGGGGEYDEEDGFVVADTDEDDDYGGSRSKSKKKNRNKKRKSKYTDDEDEDEELDEMEEAERRIEERERERKRAKKDSGAASGSGSSKKKSRDYVDTDEDEDEAQAQAQAQDGDGDEDQDAEGEEDMEMDVESEEE